MTLSIRKNKRWISLTLLVFVCFVYANVVRAVIQVNTSSTVFITAQVCGGTSTCTGGGGSGGSGGGGGGGGGGYSIQTTVNFSGMGYPSSKVVILQDGTQVITTTSDPNANFSASLTSLTPGSYTFSIYTTDANGLHSVSFSFPVSITAGATINIGGIILAPTIDVDKTEVKQGDNEAIFGFAVPNSQVNIAVHSAVAHLVTTNASPSGAYLYNFDTTPLELGSHDAQSHAILGDKVSATTDPVDFIVSDQNVSKTTGCGTLVGDINCDGKVNLVDFSIMAYWYKKGTTPPANVDLNSDGKISLVDFSILTYHWTG